MLEADLAAPAITATKPALPRRALCLGSPAIEWLAIAVLLAVFVGQGFLPAWRTLNTDFPNYYAVARIYRGAHRLSPEIYDWQWLQRHSHLGRVVTYVPFPPLDFLPVLPLAGLPPLAAKHAWLVVNLFLLGVTLWLLAHITPLRPRSVVLLALLCVVPLRVQFVNGQMYLLLLFLCTLALWLYQRGRPIAGAFSLAAGAALKLYPALFVILFLRKRQWRAAAALLAGSIASLAVAAALVGIAPVQRFVTDVLPHAARGEVITPFDLGYSSVNALLHYWLVPDEVLNPHPAFPSTLLFSLLQPLCSGLLLAVAAIGISPRHESETLELDWAAVMVLVLALSPLTLSYHDCLLIAPATLAIAYFLRCGRARAAAATLAAYLLVGLPVPVPHGEAAWQAPLHMPRLLGCIALLAIFVWHRRANFAGAGRMLQCALVALVVAVPGIAANLRHFAIVDPWPRVAVGQFAMNADPTYANGELWYTALTDSGYRTRSAHGGSIGPADADSFHPTAGGKGDVWIETVRRRSQIFEYANYGAGPAKYVTDGASPVVSPDERWLAFLRDDGSQAQLWIRSLAEGSEFPVRLPGYEILEASLSQAEVVFAAQRGLEISLFRQALSPAAGPQPILTGRVRYPAISPDRRHLAFSRWSRGTWHLWIRNLPTGEGRQMTFADCNAVTPAWSDDGRTLFYASDCGRLGLTTLRAIPVVPAQ